MKQEGRSFDCATCPKSIQKIRRCREDRFDLTAEDGNIFPMYINKGGTLFGFCPAKATWDHAMVAQFNYLTVLAETRQLPRAGGLDDQDTDIIDILAWFLPKYDMQKFIRKAEMILGNDNKSQKAISNRPSGVKGTQRGRR